jgi:hypothetical protein
MTALTLVVALREGGMRILVGTGSKIVTATRLVIPTRIGGVLGG